MVGALGCALLCLLLAACFLKKKNFVGEELSRPFCGGTHIGTPTMPSACCLLPRRRKTLFGMNFLDLSVDGRHTGMRTAMPILRVACHPKKKNFV